jgi:hypothetical protein
MRQRIPVVVSGAALLVVVALGVTPAGQNKVPNTPWGKPDLRGIWDFRTITPLERPANLADREFLTAQEAAKLEQDAVDRETEQQERPPERTTPSESVDRRADGTPGFYNSFWLDSETKPVGSLRTSLLIDPPNGKLPALTEAAQQRAAARRAYLKEHPADSWLDRNPSDRCLVGFNAGPPITPGFYNQNLQIFQTPTHVALLTEMVHTTRIVPLDGRPPLRDSVQQWSGDSRGHWEGETLVVRTTNFKRERDWKGSSAQMTLIERLRRVDTNTLEYTYTVNDPETWTKPWTAQLQMRLNTLPLYEYACHEGNYSLANILSGHRAKEKVEGTKP